MICFRISFSLDLSFSNVFASAGLTQITREGTFFHAGNFPDLCLELDLDRVGFSRVFPPLPSSPHCSILLYVFQSQFAETNNDGLPDRLWTKGKYNLISESLGYVD